MTTKIYNVKSKVSYGKADENGKIIVKPKDYAPGQQIELDDEDAAPLLQAGAIEPIEKSKK